MQQMKIDIFKEAITISKMPNNSYKNARRLIVGREDINEIRSYIIFENPVLKVDFNIEKIELVLFLKEIDLKNNTDKFMLNIGIAIEPLKDNITWNTSPKFFQESIMYKVSDKYKEKYIRFDITYLYKKYQEYVVGKFCLALVGLNANATVEFASSDSEKTGYLEICPSSKLNINNKNRNEEEKEVKKVIENNEIKKFEHDKRLDGNLKSNRNGTDRNSKINNRPERDKDESINASKVFCEVYTNENKVVNRGEFNTVVLERLAVYNGAYLDKDRLGIIILKPGIYNIQYTVNCVSEGISTMAISVDDAIVESSIVQIGNNEGQITGQCIVRLNKGNEKIRLNIDGDKIVLINVGVVAKISLIEI